VTPADDDVLDVAGVMALMHMGRNAVYDACAKHQIPHRRIGKLLRFSRRAILEWLGESAFRTSDDMRSLSSCGRSQSAQNRH
jgi:predicted DNA-binding transcriptional regulator AlpA